MIAHITHCYKLINEFAVFIKRKISFMNSHNRNNEFFRQSQIIRIKLANRRYGIFGNECYFFQ